MSEPALHPLARAFNERMTRWMSFLVRRERAILLWAAGIFIVVFSAIGAWKLWSFGYNALDLAIYRQVAAESIRGNLFSFTIHPHSYLGDHFELLFALVWPFYAMLKTPFTLIVVQAAALALSVFPIAAITRRILPKPWHLLFALGYLANPVVQNMALYEFHLLPFSILFLSFAVLAYLKKQYPWFLVSLVLACCAREDVGFVVFGLGILALVDRRPWKWSVVPLLLGPAWVFTALKITAAFNGYGQYKFLAYYGWLGSSVPEIMKNIVLHVDKVLMHFMTPQCLSFTIALLLPVAFLPLFRLRWLIPVIPSYLQFLLMQSPSELVVEIHYPSVFIPFLIVASAAAFRPILDPASRRSVLNRLSNERGISTLIVAIVIIYSMLVIGPLAQSVPVIARTASISDRATLERDFVASIPDGPVVAGYETITALSDRPRLYSLHYEFLGRKQFSNESYSIPDDAETVLVDLRDFLMYQLLYKYNDKDNQNGYRRIRELLSDRGFVLTSYCDRFAIFEKNGTPSGDSLYSTGTQETLNGTQSTHDDLKFLGWSSPTNSLAVATYSIRNHTYTTLPISITFKKLSDTNTGNLVDNLWVKFIKDGVTKYETPLPLGGGLYPVNDWAVGETVTSNYRLLVPASLQDKEFEVSITVYRSGGEVSLNGTRSMVIKYRDLEELGDTIDLGRVTR